MINEKLFYPIISSIYPDYNVNIATNGAASIVISHRDGKKNALLHKHLNIATRKHFFALPFGGIYIIPLILLVFQKNWELAKKLTVYHLFIALIPLFILLPILNNLYLITPVNILSKLNIVLGFIFTLVVFKGFSSIDKKI